MRYTPTVLYSKSLSDLDNRISKAIERGCAQIENSQPVNVFFRADDVGVPSRLFHELITLFSKHKLPLCLAVVPSWISVQRYSGLREITGNDDTLWCWHQHGRLHKNFEIEGKKQEFGPGRDYETILYHLQQGKERLISILRNSFDPFFTPPWNRCSIDTAKALLAEGFQAVSRSQGAQPDVTAFLPDIQVNVDLHTRKETDPETSMKNLLNEIETALSSGQCGIMIHHQRMNRRAFLLLDRILHHLARRRDINPVLFRDLV